MFFHLRYIYRVSGIEATSVTRTQNSPSQGLPSLVSGYTPGQWGTVLSPSTQQPSGPQHTPMCGSFLFCGLSFLYAVLNTSPRPRAGISLVVKGFVSVTSIHCTVGVALPYLCHYREHSDEPLCSITVFPSLAQRARKPALAFGGRDARS